jgi:hypothetical protein
MSAECFTCRLNAQPGPPPRERILVRDGWRVAHNFETPLPGWLVAVHLRHVTRLAEQPSFAYVRFHVVPRMAGFGEEDLGPRVMRHLGDGAGPHVREDEMDRLALELRRELGG